MALQWTLDLSLGTLTLRPQLSSYVRRESHWLQSFTFLLTPFCTKDPTSFQNIQKLCTYHTWLPLHPIFGQLLRGPWTCSSIPFSQSLIPTNDMSSHSLPVFLLSSSSSSYFVLLNWPFEWMFMVTTTTTTTTAAIGIKINSTKSQKNADSIALSLLGR